MCDPTSEEQGCIRLGQIGWVEGVSIGKEIADMVKSHNDHNKTAKHINGEKTRPPA